MTNPHSEWALDCPLNNLSFGNVSIALLREMYQRGLSPSVFPLNGQVDLGTQKPDEGFSRWLQACINKAQGDHDRKKTSIRLWHVNGSLNSYSSADSRLITFHECDQITNQESNILRQQDRVYVTSRFTQSVFKLFGVDSEYLPLGYDAHNFPMLEKRNRVEGAIQFTVAGKWEERKAHSKILRLWAKKYGNNPKYRLNAALHNPFLRPEHQAAFINQALEGKSYYNITMLPWMATNAEFNSFLHSSDIHLALSGGEGWNLPAYHAVALGSHAVVLNAHAHKDWATPENAVLVQPSGKRPAADGVFFHANSPFNVGNFWDFNEEGFYAGCEEAEKRSAKGLNVAGYALQKQTYSQAVDILTRDLK